VCWWWRVSGLRRKGDRSVEGDRKGDRLSAATLHSDKFSIQQCACGSVWVSVVLVQAINSAVCVRLSVGECCAGTSDKFSIQQCACVRLSVGECCAGTSDNFSSVRAAQCE
jgi:hypothetical protein